MQQPKKPRRYKTIAVPLPIPEWTLTQFVQVMAVALFGLGMLGYIIGDIRTPPPQPQPQQAIIVQPTAQLAPTQAAVSTIAPPTSAPTQAMIPPAVPTQAPVLAMQAPTQAPVQVVPTYNVNQVPSIQTAMVATPNDIAPAALVPGAPPAGGWTDAMCQAAGQAQGAEMASFWGPISPGPASPAGTGCNLLIKGVWITLPY